VHDDRINSIAFSPDGERFATASSDKTVRVWSVATGQQLLRLEHPYAIWDLRYSHDGRRLAALAPEDADLQIWDATSGERQMLVEHEDLIWQAEYSSDDRWIATASRDNSVAIWNAATGARTQRLVHPGPALGASFSPNSRWIVTWDAWGGPARIWEVATGTEVARFPTDGISSIAWATFSPDGSRIVLSRDDGLVQIHSWRAKDIVSDICSRITRNLSEDEWRRFIGEEPYRPTCPGIRSGAEE
jgi:WD40 repeat protein